MIEALRRADVIVAGPGSLYTSILPPLLVPDVATAIERSHAVRILVANLMTEPGETDHFGVLEHLLTIERHLGRQLFDCVIYNTDAGARGAGGGVSRRRFLSSRCGIVCA